MELFLVDDYKTYLKGAIKEAARRGFLTEMARAAACTQSYLSQVLNGKPELTPDQALMITAFLGMKAEAADYFMNLVHLSRASSSQLRSFHEKKIKSLRDQHLRTSTAVRATTQNKIPLSERDYYYAQWTVPAVHILTSCHEYQTAERLAERLNLGVREVETILQRLAQIGLVKKSAGRFIHSGKNVHLETHSLHNQINHLNWRLKGLNSTQQESAIHYTSSFAIDRKDWDRMRRHLLTFLEEQRKQIGGSGSEDAYVFCCDLFRV